MANDVVITLRLVGYVNFGLNGMTMSSLAVFLASLFLTAVVGAFVHSAWRSARNVHTVAAFWGSALLVHIAWFYIPRLGDNAPIARWVAIIWLASMLAAACLLIPFGLLTVLLRKRRAISTYLPLMYAGTSLLCGTVLAITSTAPFVVRQEEISVLGLPAGLDGFRIANLGDVHIGYFIDPQELRRGIEAINIRAVDLLAVTGDLVDDVNQLESTMRVLQLSNAPNIIAILGNHEQTGDLTRIRSIYQEHDARIQLLENQNVSITRAGALLHVVGVTFPTIPGGRRLSHPDVEDAIMNAQADAAFDGLAKGDTIVALSHQPAFFPIAASRGAQLTLASHTHGGQIRLFGRPVVGAYSFLQGLYKIGEASLDVSAGFGHWLPIRFGVPREIVIVTLRPCLTPKSP